MTDPVCQTCRDDGRILHLYNRPGGPPGNQYVGCPDCEKGRSYTNLRSSEGRSGQRLVMPHHGWTCFHCGETFTDREAARLHFGDECMSYAACQIDAKMFRDMEQLLARYRAEDSDADRAFHSMRAEHTVALRRAEETGYDRGLRDARDLPDERV